MYIFLVRTHYHHTLPPHTTHNTHTYAHTLGNVEFKGGVFSIVEIKHTDAWCVREGETLMNKEKYRLNVAKDMVREFEEGLEY